jgi:hypothetical protein
MLRTHIRQFLQWSIRAMGCLVLANLLLVLLPTALHAQTSAGQVTGTVTDTSGAVVPGANVTLTNTGTGIANSTVANDSGNFIFINVQPGSYEVAVQLEGFKPVKTEPFVVQVNQTVTRMIKLDAGSVTENVTVTVDAPMLSTASPEIGTVITEKAVHDLPLNGRNFTQLLTLTPGATPVSTAQGSSVGFQDAGISAVPGSAFSKPAIHGQENRSTLYYMDGIFNTDLRGPVYGVLPIVDVVQEFKVESHNQNTEFGGVVGGIVNIASKSGTNALHGSGWEFLRNNNLDARDPFKDASTSKPAEFHQNEFGASFGGPIIHNKTFFYAGYEGWRYTKPSQTLAWVPTPAELAGDFTGSPLKQDLYNPFTTRANPNQAGAFIRDRFQCDGAGNPIAPFADGSQAAGTPCNKIPAALISPQMAGLFKAYLQAPNLTGDPAHNYIENRTTTDDSDNWQIKIDHRIGEGDSAFFRLSQMWVNHLEPVVGVQSTTPSDYHAYNFGGGWDHLFRESLVLDVRGGVLRKPYVFNQAKADAGIDPLNQLGFKDLSRFDGMIVDLQAPWITGDIGNRGDSLRGNPDWQLGGSLTWLKGNHNIKGGGQFVSVDRLQINTFQQFRFQNTQTSNPASSGNTGLSLASALIGLPNDFSGQLADLGEVNFRSSMWSAYVQDEWRLKSNLTVNWGVRYDVLLRPKMLNDRLSNALDIPNGQFLIGADSIPDCKATQQNPCFPGNGFAAVPFNDRIVLAGTRKALVSKPIYDNVGPRVGMAWTLNPRTVLRAGYGLFWDALPARSQYSQNDIEANSWPWTTAFSGTANQTGPAALQPIGGLVGGFPTPVAAVSPWVALNGGFADDPNYKDGYSNQWNVEVQRDLGAKMMVAVAYVGSRNGRLAYTGFMNAASTPFPSGTPASVIDTARLMPWMTANVHYTQSIGYSRYNSLQVKFERRMSNGFSTLVSYTYSKSRDTTSGYFGVEDGAGSRSSIQNYVDVASNEGPSGYDVPQFLSWYSLWELPFGSGKKWLTSGPASWILGNWSIQSIAQARSGQPFNVGIMGDVANIGGSGTAIQNYERPNLIGNPYPSNQSAKMWFDPTAFAVPSGAFGNFGRNGLRSANVYNVDLSLFRNVPFGGDKTLQLRIEAFNVFNIQNLGVPNGTTIANPLPAGVGQVTSIIGTPRQIQLGARFVF